MQLRAVLVGVVVLAGALLFTPYEAFLEGIIALVIVAAAVVGFLMHPRREVFYVRTSFGQKTRPRSPPDQELIAGAL